MIKAIQGYLPAFTIYVIMFITIMNLLALTGSFDNWTKRLLRKKFRKPRLYLTDRPVA